MPGIDTLKDQLLDLEHAGWRSLCDGTAAEFYGRTMTDDGVMVLANGQVMGRDEVIAALRDSPPWAGYEIDEPRVISIGAEGAALVYLGTGHRDGADFRGVMTSVYRRIGGTWQAAVYQQTPVDTGH